MGGGTPCGDNHLQITELMKPFNISMATSFHHLHGIFKIIIIIIIIIIISRLLSSFGEPLGGYLIGRYMWMVK
jgi:uncharacterized membrane protein YcfT